jgi:hypothetical protein
MASLAREGANQTTPLASAESRVDEHLRSHNRQRPRPSGTDAEALAEVSRSALILWLRPATCLHGL